MDQQVAPLAALFELNTDLLLNCLQDPTTPSACTHRTTTRIVSGQRVSFRVNAYRCASTRIVLRQRAGGFRIAWSVLIQPRDSAFHTAFTSTSRPTLYGVARLLTRRTVRPRSEGLMIAARRFITALAFTGFMLGSSPLAPGSLTASAPLSSSSLSDFCRRLQQVIEYLEAHSSPLNNFLLNYFLAVKAHYCYRA